MATYQDQPNVIRVQHAAFDEVFAPGQIATHPGIYRCVVCGHEIAIAGTHILPPQNHHQHAAAQGPIRWKLLVYADAKK
jgi:hypothetical protein